MTLSLLGVISELRSRCNITLSTTRCGKEKGRKEGRKKERRRKEEERRKEGKKEGRKEGKEGRKEERKEERRKKEYIVFDTHGGEESFGMAKINWVSSVQRKCLPHRLSLHSFPLYNFKEFQNPSLFCFI